MSSQEEYLDRLLKNLGAENINTKDLKQSEEVIVTPNRVFVDDSSSATESLPEEITEAPIEDSADQLLANELDSLLADEDFLNSLNDLTVVDQVPQEPDEIQSVDDLLQQEFSEIQSVDDLLQQEFSEIQSVDDLLQQEADDIPPVENVLQKESVLSGLEDLLKDADELEDDNAFAYAGFMSEEEVERALRESAALSEEEPVSLPDKKDLYTLLESDSGNDGTHIKDMLEKDENNEAVDAGILELLQGNFEDEEPALFDTEDEATEVTAVSDIDGVTAGKSKSVRAAEKKAQRDMRAAQKREMRELKRQEKEAKKRERAQAKRDRAFGNTEEPQVTLPHVDEAKVIYNEVQGGMDAIQDIATVDMDGFQDITSVGMDGLQNVTAVDLEALQGIELSDLGLTGVDFADLQAIQMTDADASADALFEELSAGGLMNDLLNMSDEAAIISDYDTSATENVAGKTKSNRVNKAKNRSIFTRFMDFLTEEEEEDNSKGNENLNISDENMAILKEMDNQPGKKKKGKTPEELEEQKKKKEEKLKAKQEKQKEKQEKKAQKVQAMDDMPAKPLSRKKVSAVIILGISACVLIVIISAVMIEYMTKREGRQAYYDQDYETCYQNFFGKELDESEQIMFHRSEMILKMRLWIREYEILAEEGSEMEALDSLIQSVYEYPDLFEYSNQWNAGSDVQAIYNELLTILDTKYHLSEEDAGNIANIKDDVEYTRAVKAIVDGMSYQEWLEQKKMKEQKPSGDSNSSGGQNATKEETDVPVLPEEENMGNIEFIDNI